MGSSRLVFCFKQAKFSFLFSVQSFPLKLLSLPFCIPIVLFLVNLDQVWVNIYCFDPKRADYAHI